MDLQLWLIFLAAAVGLSLTPGPNGLLVLTHGMRFGWRRTLATAIGGVAGFMVLTAASMAGLGALLATSEKAFGIVKWIGAAYLIYLGITTWRAPAPVVAPAAERNEATERDETAEPLAAVAAVEPMKPSATLAASAVHPSWRRRFAEGFIVAISNPKGLIFFAAFLPQFMQPGVALWLQFLILGGTFGLVELAYEVVVASAAQRIAPWLGRNGRWFNRIAGATFVGIGGLLAMSRR
jgi:homoserine/homoserine lactone efflux protein